MMNHDSSMNVLRAQLLKEKAFSLGFSDCGIAKACSLEKEWHDFEHAIRKKYHAGISFLERNRAIRFDPRLLFPECRSVIVVLYPYLINKEPQFDRYLIAKYAHIKDYHLVVKEKLQQLVQYIHSVTSNAICRITVDSSCISEKNWAVKAGLGYIGKNSLLQTQKGSFCVIGTVLTDQVFEYDEEKRGDCGTCELCMQACPAKAITDPYRINAEQCIAYQTIENKKSTYHINENSCWVFGCDICQDVCPHNRKKLINLDAVRFSSLFLQLQNEDFEKMTKERFDLIFAETPLQRRGFEKFRKSIQNEK